MNIKEIIIDHLDFVGADGLYNEWIDCFCSKCSLFGHCTTCDFSDCKSGIINEHGYYEII